MADFKNHRRFSLRCLSEDVIPVSIRLRSNMRTPKGQYIIRRAEKALLNERIQSINNSIYMFNYQLDARKTDMEKIINKEDLKECQNFINIRREARHSKTMDRQKQKLNQLCHRNNSNKGGCSNIHGDHVCITTDSTDISPVTTNTSTNMKKWVINISRKPLTEAQEKVLACGPNNAVLPKSPPITEYVAVIEQAWSKLQGEAEKLRGKSNPSLRKHTIPPNITKEEMKGITELKKDSSRMVLTADKGVSLVVMDTAEYKKKAEELLQWPIYQPIPTDPASKYKNKLISMFKSIKAEGGISEAVYKRLYPTGVGSPKFYGLPKIHKRREAIKTNCI